MDWVSQFDMFMPHGMCLLWRPELMALHIVSDALIALAYFTIPFSIVRFVRDRGDLEPGHLRLAVLFATFIGSCGLTHVVSIVVLWVPIYIVEGWLKAITAVASVVSAGWLIALVPHAVKLPSVAAMHREINAHRDTMAALDAARTVLASKVDRTEGELRAAERDLQESHALLSSVVELVPGLIYAKDRSGQLLLANQATLDLIGKPWREVKGQTDGLFLPNPRQAEKGKADDRRVMDEGMTEEVEEIIDHPTKGPRVYLSTKVPFGDVQGMQGMVGLSIDITERKKLAEELMHVSRRAAMGDMAATIAHEINQPLAAAAFYLDGSTKLLASEHYEGPLIEALTTAKDQCLRAGEIIRRVRSFVSGGGDDKQCENVSHLVDEACSLACVGSQTIGVAVSIEHDHASVPVFVNQVQIAQVIINLIRNAIDALIDVRGASIRVTTGYGANGMALVSVSDNGPGISSAVAGRLFEPFVSTKGVKGMGVGLSISRQIVESHGGRIWVEPTPGAGATFCFTLPSIPRAEAA